MEWTTVTSCPQSVASPSAPGVINPDLIIQALVSNRNIQVVTGLDRQFLLRRLGAQWTVESALKECKHLFFCDWMHSYVDLVLAVEGPTIQEGFKSNGISPFLKLSPALMHIENLSLQSLVRTQYGVGVNDLREALEGRASVTNLALSTRPSSVRTLDNPSASTSKEPLGLTRSNTHITISKNSSTNDVRDVLKSLGAGKGKRKSSSRLKPSFPGIQSPDARYVCVTWQRHKPMLTKNPEAGLVLPHPIDHKYTSLKQTFFALFTFAAVLSHCLSVKSH